VPAAAISAAAIRPDSRDTPEGRVFRDQRNAPAHGAAALAGRTMPVVGKARKPATTPAPLSRQRLGADAEERAAQLLCDAGYLVVARNYRCRLGELDIVARRGAQLVIAEVRLRSSRAYGGPAASVGAAKRARIVRATRHLLMRQPQLAGLEVRFDTLLLSASDGPIEWIEAAFYT
jgi:putative endonuclease